MKKSILGAGMVMALALAGCATPPPATTTSAPAPGASGSAADPSSDFLACMVSDSGGWDDKSFNETSYKGLLDAEKKLGIKKKDIQSSTDSDYAPNVKQMVDAKCNIIVTVGFKLGDATQKAAAANPNIKFAIVDFAYDKPEANLKGLVFNTDEPSFMAGYAAASLSKSGKVGTWGGMKIPTVTVFMDGFAQGVEHYNKAKGKSVQVLGWDRAKKDGQFNSGGDKAFENKAGGQQVTASLAAQGADVIMPVAGPAGEGALQYAQQSGGKVSAIWVDTDGYVSQAPYKSVIATSVGKAMDVAVFEAIKAAKEGTFKNDLYVGTLKNSGAYLAPFHDYDAKVSAETKAELEKIKADIIAGTIKIEA